MKVISLLWDNKFKFKFLLREVYIFKPVKVTCKNLKKIYCYFWRDCFNLEKKYLKDYIKIFYFWRSYLKNNILRI